MTTAPTAIGVAEDATDSGWRRLFPWMVLVLLPIAVHWPDLCGWLSENPIDVVSGLSSRNWMPNGLLTGYPGWIDGNAGVTTQALGRLAATDWLHGVVPWWNPYSGVGLPLAAEMQPAALFLPFVLLLGLADGVTALKIALQIIDGCAIYALLCTLCLGRLPALAGGVLGALQGSFAWFAHAPILPVPFLPLLLLGIEQVCRRTGGGRWMWISVAVAWSLLAGFPETAYLDGLLAAVWAGWRWLRLGATRWRFLGILAWGGGLGLLIAAPLLLAFLETLPISFLSTHADTAAAHLRPGNYPMLLLPYIYGPPLWAYLRAGQAPDLWFSTGGYVGLTLVFLSLLALLGPLLRRGAPPARELGLRWVLAGWVVLSLGKAAHLPVATKLFDMVPGVRATMFHLYIEPSWHMAALVLAALAIDDWTGCWPPRSSTRGPRVGQRLGEVFGLAPVLAGALALAIAGAALLLAQHALGRALLVPHARRYLLGSVAWGTAEVAALAALFSGPAARLRRQLLFGFVTLDAVALFSAPLLCGTRNAVLDLGAVRFLRDHLGLARSYSLDALVPNYGAMFRVASINHNYLPVPQIWVDAVRARLLPGMDGVNFFTGFDTAPGGTSGAQLLRDRLPAYAAMGVKYVMAPPGRDPFEDVSETVVSGPGTADMLQPGGTLTGLVDPELVRSGAVTALGVTIGTYQGRADGQLALELCTVRACASGSASLAGAADNASRAIPLERPLAVAKGEVLRYRLQHQHGSQAVAIWLWQLARGGVPNSADAPQLRLSYAAMGPRPHRVFAGPRADLFELPNVAPYFAASAGCRVSASTRNAAATDCLAAGSLRRLELLYPGWRATVNGAQVPITAADRIFQQITLPAGRSRVVFTYAPPHIGWAYAAAGLGLCCLLAGIGRRLVARGQSRAGLEPAWHVHPIAGEPSRIDR